MQFKKTSYSAIAVVAIASIAGGWFAINSSAFSNQNQIPNLNSDDANSMRGMMQHGGHGHTTAPNHGGIPGMMHHTMAMDLGSADEYYDLRFIDAMRLHHRGAIAMAKEGE